MPCSPFGANARSQQTQTPAIPLTRPRFGQIQHRGTYHPPQCQGMRANGRIQRRRFRRTRHEKTNEPTSPRARPRPRPRLSPSPSPSPNHRLRARAVLAQGKILPRILPSGRGSAWILPSESRPSRGPDEVRTNFDLRPKNDAAIGVPKFYVLVRENFPQNSIPATGPSAACPGPSRVASTGVAKSLKISSFYQERSG